MILENDIHNGCGEFAMSFSNTRRALVHGNNIRYDAELNRGVPVGFVDAANCVQTMLAANTLTDPVELPVLTQGPECRDITMRQEASERSKR